MNFLKNRRFQLESLEERTLLTAAPWSTADETDYSGLVVTTLEDVVDASDQLNSIREAIAYAESLEGPAEVTFAKGLAGKITLTGGALQVNSVYELAVNGGDRISIDAGGRNRAFEIGSGSVTLSNLTIENGYNSKQGGAIYSAGDLTLNAVTISDSYSGQFGSAVHVFSKTHLTVTDSNFVNNTARTHGGGIFVSTEATADITGSYFSGNASGTYGGALYVWDGALVSVANSFFVNNNAPSGAIRNHGGELSLVNVVISGNEQGISAAAGSTTTATNVTISNNTRSAVRGEDGAAIHFYNSIVIDGRAVSSFGAGIVVDGDNNLSDVEFGTNFIRYDGGDLFAADGYTLYGQNQAYAAGNPAYNTTEYDAAGNSRYYGGALDLGALQQLAYAYGTTVTFNGEVQMPVAFNDRVTSAKYSEDGRSWSDSLNYRNAGSYTFYVAAGTETGEEEIFLVTGDIAPLQLTVSGSSVADKVYDGTTGAEIIVGDVATLYDEVAVTGTGEFDSAEPGVHSVTVAYAVTGDLAFNYLAPAGEVLEGEIIYVEPSSLVVTTLEDVVDRADDVTSIREAVAYAETFDTAVTVTFADGLEGVISLTDGAVVFASGAQITIDGNHRIMIDAGGADRAFEITSGAAVLANITLTGGYAARQGGAISSAGDLTLESVTISDSYSGKYGGAIYVAPGTNLNVTESSFIGNSSKTHGGAIYIDKGATAEITDSFFSRNTTGSYGAAVYIWNDAVVSVGNTVFFTNPAPNGTLRNYGGELNLVNVVISGNDQGFSSSAAGRNTAVNVTIADNVRSAVRGEENSTFVFYNSVLMSNTNPDAEEQVSPIDMRTGATITGDVNL